MKLHSIFISLAFLLSFNSSFGQFLKEQDWATLSSYAKSNNTSDFESFLAEKDFLKDPEPNDKYTFYNWKKTDGHYYGVRINNRSKQVTYLTNDQHYVLKLFSRFASEYTLTSSEKQGQNATLHIFRASESTIAIKIDDSPKPGTHMLFATKH